MWVYRKGTSKPPEKRAPKNIAIESDFYSVETDTAGKIEAVEEALSRLESRVAPILRRVIASQQVPRGKERLMCAFLLAVMLTRTAKARKEINAAIQDLARKMNLVVAQSEDRLKAVVRRMERETGKHVDMPVDKLRKFILDGQYDIIPGKQWSLMAMIQVSPTLVPVLAGMKWRIHVAPNQCVYVTSDNPVVIAESGTSRLLSPCGLFTNNVMVTLPLNSQVCLSLMWTGSDGNYGVTKRKVLETNKRTIVFADKYVYSSKPLKSVQYLVQHSLTAETMTLRVELA